MTLRAPVQFPSPAGANTILTQGFESCGCHLEFAMLDAMSALFPKEILRDPPTCTFCMLPSYFCLPPTWTMAAEAAF